MNKLDRSSPPTDLNNPEAIPPHGAPATLVPEKFGDEQMDAIMGRLLQVGVLLASAVVLVGGGLYLRMHHTSPPDYAHFHREASAVRQPAAMFRAIAVGNPAAIIQLGILLLIATPIARVVFAAIAFAIERDRLYVAISLIILAVLLYGFFQPQ